MTTHLLRMRAELARSVSVSALVLALIVALVGVPRTAFAQNTGPLPAITDFGAFDSRKIPIELQAWWTPVPDDGRGYGHIHALCQWPIGQPVSGTLTSDCRITLHDNPAHNYQLRFDVYNSPGNTVKTYAVSHDCPYDGSNPTDCSWTQPVSLDTSSWGAGWQRLRVRAAVKTPDGRRWTTSSDIVMNVKGAGSETRFSSNCEAGSCFGGKGWYEGNDYQVARIQNVPLTKLKGTHVFSVGIHKNPAQRMEVWLDKGHFIPATGSFPAENPSAGVSLLTVDNPATDRWQDVALDTTRLANGWHSLAVRSVGSKPGTASCSYCAAEPNFQTGVAKVFFYVEN